MKTELDCVAMKHQGAEKVREKISGLTIAEEMKLPDASVGVSSGVLSIVNDASVGELNPNKIKILARTVYCVAEAKRRSSEKI